MNAPAPQHQGYPLSSLFLLIALIAAISAHISPLFNAPLGSSEPQNLVMLSFLSGTAGAFFGMVIGLYHYRRVKGLIWGVLLGVVFGSLCGPVFAASFTYPWQTMVISGVSTVVLLGIAALFRRINDTDPVSSRDAYEAKLRQWKAPAGTNPFRES